MPISYCFKGRAFSWVPLAVIALSSANANTPSTVYNFTNKTTWTPDQRTVALNAAIQSAITSKKTTFVLPAGTYVLDGPILIPAGTSGFEIKGAGGRGSDAVQTIFQVMAGTSGNTFQRGFLRIGPPIYNYAGHSQIESTYPVTPLPATVSENATSLIPGGSLATGYYLLYDNRYVRNWTGSSTNCEYTDHELVNVTGSAGGQIQQTLGWYNRVPSTPIQITGAGRDYLMSDTPKVAYVNAVVSKNLTVDGIYFDCNQYPNNDRTQAPLNVRTVTGGLFATFVDGLTVYDCESYYTMDQSFHIAWSRNVLVHNVRSHDTGGNVHLPGGAYGLTYWGCRFVVSHDNDANTSRHGNCLVHTGTMDVEVYGNGESVNSPASIDMRGHYSRRVWVHDLGTAAVPYGGQGGGDISAGNNGNWRGNVQWITIQRCNINGDISYGSTNDLLIDSCTAAYLYQSSCQGDPSLTAAQVQIPASTFPSRITVQNSTFDTSRSLISTGNATVSTSLSPFQISDFSGSLAERQIKFANVALNNCTFIRNSTSPASYPVLEVGYANGSAPSEGDMTFSGCVFAGNNASNQGTFRVNLSDGVAPLQVNLYGCTFAPFNLTSRNAISISATPGGNASMTSLNLMGSMMAGGGLSASQLAVTNTGLATLFVDPLMQFLQSAN